MKRAITYDKKLFEQLSESQKSEANKIVNTLFSAMDKYYEGDPHAFMTLYCENDFTYIDSGTEKRMNSTEEILQHFDAIKGKVIASEYRIDDLAIQFANNVAIVTFQMFVTAIGTDFKWNVTEVFRYCDSKDWLIFHSHYSFIRPMDWEYREGQFSLS